MRTFVIASFILVASFGAPLFTNADTSCTVNGQTGLLVNGVCSTTATQCQGVAVGAPCFTSSGVNGKCDASGVCQATTVTGNSNTNTGTNVTLFNPLKGVDCSRGNGDCLSSFLLSILDFVINIGSIVVILMLVYVGFKFVVAQGSDTKISEARTMLLWTIIGALILLGSKAIALGVKATISALGG